MVGFCHGGNVPEGHDGHDDHVDDDDDLGMVSGVPLVAVKAHSASCAEAFAQVALQKFIDF